MLEKSSSLIQQKTVTPMVSPFFILTSLSKLNVFFLLSSLAKRHVFFLLYSLFLIL